MYEEYTPSEQKKINDCFNKINDELHDRIMICNSRDTYPEEQRKKEVDEVAKILKEKYVDLKESLSYGNE